MLVLQVFHNSWDFNLRLPLEGERTDYRISVIRGKRGKVGEEVGLRRVFSLLRASPPDETPEVGVDEDEKEFEDMNESNEPVIEETPEEIVEEVTEEVATEPVGEEEVPLEVEAPPVEEEPAVVEEAASEVIEPEPVIEEVPEEPEVIEPEPEPEAEPESPYSMVFEPETPVYTDGANDVIVIGKLLGFLPQDELHAVVEKSTSDDNGWIVWTERDVSLNGERALAFV